MIYFITLFGISKILFFSPIVKVGTTRTENVMELFGYTTTEWFLIAGFLAIGAWWLAVDDWDER